jgi:hypothetical protein
MLPSVTGTTNPTATRTHTATITPTSTMTPVSLLPRTEEDIARIEGDVVEIRGLEKRIEPEIYVLTKNVVEPMLLNRFINEEFVQVLQDEARVLVALGLVDPQYDLVTNYLNNIVDYIGGFYIPGENEIYVIGSILFDGVEKFIYVHEFTHALQDQNFPIITSDYYPNCKYQEQACTAMDALIEGEAELVQYIWLQNYAVKEDYKDISRFTPSPQYIPEEAPPPFAARDLMFPYTEGAVFATFLYEKGGWVEINRAYARPPTTTEQILHPEKYIEGEGGISVRDAPLGDVLGDEWLLIKDETLGEWRTYLILEYSANIDGFLPDGVAASASAGWGGDHYQVYFNDETGQSTMTVHWVWDTIEDADEFASTFDDYLSARFSGAMVSRGGGSCYTLNQQYTCMFRYLQHTLWILAPDQGALELVLTLFPNFR